MAAFVDTADAFDPASAATAGADLERMLWVRARHTAEALRAAERLLEARGFALVLVDLAGPDVRSVAPAIAAPAASAPAVAAPAVAALRLARAAAASETALVLVGAQRFAGATAELALEMQPRRARFTGTPPLLEGLDVRAILVRHRAITAWSEALLDLRSAS
jgi:hypothetical protein